MSTAAVRRAQTVSRVAMSPGTVREEDSMYSILNEAKEELRKEKKAKVRELFYVFFYNISL